MDYKRFLVILFTASVIVSLFVYYTSSFTDFGTAVFSFGIAIAVTSPIVWLFEKAVFDIWKTFTLFWIGLSAFLILLTPSYRMSSGFVFAGLDKELVAMGSAVLFFIVSIILIAWKAYQLRHK